MDKKKLERLNAMEEEIARLKANIGWWEDVDSIKELTFRDRNWNRVCVDYQDIDVQKLKAETLYSMKNKLAKLEKEFMEA